MSSPTRFKVQQLTYGFRMYDSYTEHPVDGELARFDVNVNEADLVEEGGRISIVNGEVVVEPPLGDPMMGHLL